jgi:hypothetical protein
LLDENQNSGEIMKLSKFLWMRLLVAVVAFGSLSAYAIPVRQSSDNGTGGNVDFWTVLGRTVQIPLTANGKTVKMTRQVICPQQDRSDGGCTSGNYLFLFQFQSTSANVSVNIGQLQKGIFTEVGGSDPTYGVMICDDANNDQELCTEDPNDPGYTLLSGITFKLKGATAVQFSIGPSFPAFPAGIDPAEGQGVTLFIVTQQSASLPIAFPSVGIQ